MINKYILFTLLFQLYFAGKITAQVCTACSGTGCTITSSAGADATGYTLNAGDKLCIPVGSTITGAITLSGGTISNQGTFSPSSFSFTSGLFSNCGSITVGMIIAGTFENCSVGTVNGVTFTIGASAVFTNSGAITLSGNFLIGNSATFTNCGSINLTGGASSFACGPSATQNNYGSISTFNMTIGGATTLYNECLITVRNNFAIGNTATMTGPAAGSPTYGRVNVTGTTTSLAGSTFGVGTQQLDLCDAGAPAGGWDTKNGTVGTGVTYCANNGCSTTNCAGALPIELTLFTAHCYDKNVELKWQTGTETNNDFFTIERSEDGHNYQTVATVDGAGNSTHMLSYSIEDETSFGGVFYYRLKQTDFDGKYSYSDIVAVTCASDINDKCILHHVNSTNNSLLVNYSCADYSGVINIQFINMLGQSVFNDRQQAQSGNNSFEINTEGIASGMYILKLSNKNGTFQKKIIR